MCCSIVAIAQNVTENAGFVRGFASVLFAAIGARNHNAVASTYVLAQETAAFGRTGKGLGGSFRVKLAKVRRGDCPFASAKSARIGGFQHVGLLGRFGIFKGRWLPRCQRCRWVASPSKPATIIPQKV